jgi:uncharacterized damage-inducible protein DinB
MGGMDPLSGDGSAAANRVRGGVTEPAHRGDERTTLLGFLQRQRDLVAWKLADLEDETAAGVSTSSGLTLHGIVRHLTEVETSWLREVFAGESGITFSWLDDDPDGYWTVPPGTAMTDLLAAYAAESARCDAVVRAAPSLDVVSAERGMSLRWILLHLVEETSRHLGHIDLLREQGDGVTGEDPGDT